MVFLCGLGSLEVIFSWETPKCSFMLRGMPLMMFSCDIFEFIFFDLGWKLRGHNHVRIQQQLSGQRRLGNCSSQYEQRTLPAMCFYNQFYSQKSAGADRVRHANKNTRNLAIQQSHLHYYPSPIPGLPLQHLVSHSNASSPTPTPRLPLQHLISHSKALISRSKPTS